MKRYYSFEEMRGKKIKFVLNPRMGRDDVLLIFEDGTVAEMITENDVRCCGGCCCGVEGPAYYFNTDMIHFEKYKEKDLIKSGLFTREKLNKLQATREKNKEKLERDLYKKLRAKFERPIKNEFLQ